MTEKGVAMLAKGATGGGVAMAAVLPVETWLWAVFIPMGLVLGMSARAARLLDKRKPWADVRRDFGVSLLAGGGNGLLAGMVIWTAGLNYLQGMGVAFICAFIGVGSFELGSKWALRKWVDDQRNQPSGNKEN